MDKFRVEVIAKTPNPQQAIYAALHQDYSEGFVFDDRQEWPSEEKSGELIVKRLLAGDRGHYGPLEHPSIVFNCGYFPHSVMQQVRTHRVGMCLTGDTLVYAKNTSGSIKKMPLKELYERWTQGRKHQHSSQDAEYSRRRLSKLKLYNLNENTLEFQETSIVNLYCNGEKEVYRVITRDGQIIKATLKHLFFTEVGWRKLEELMVGNSLTTRGFFGQKNPAKEVEFDADELQQEQWMKVPGLEDYEVSNLGRVRSYRLQNGKGTTASPRLKALSKSNYLFYSAYGDRRNLHVDVLTAFKGDRPNPSYVARHLDGNHYNNRLANLAWGTEKENRADQDITIGYNVCKAKFTEILSIERVGFEVTYDLEVKSEYHNFLANDLVVHNSFDVQSNRYTGQRIVDAAIARRDIEDVFYLRPVGYYNDRQGKRYEYTKEQRDRDLSWCLEAAKRYHQLIEEGVSEEHARGIIPFDVRQHWVMSVNVRSLMHLMDLRAKIDAQLECQKLCELILPHFKDWVPEIAEWYEKFRLKKARLAP